MLVGALDDALQHLPLKQRAVWVMRELEGLSTEEVGRALGIKPGTVRSRLFSARNAVMERLKREREASGIVRAISDAEAEFLYRSEVNVKRLET